MRTSAIGLLAAGLVGLSLHSLPPAQRSSSQSRPPAANSGKKGQVFRSKRLGVSFQYPYGYKLVAASPFSPPGAPSDSLPVVAAYELTPPSPPGGIGPDAPPFDYQYYIFFLKLSFSETAKALGFAKTPQGEWTYEDVGQVTEAEQLSGDGWKGLRMTYFFRLYRARTPENPNGSGYLGASEGEKTLISSRGNLTIVLEFDPDIETDIVRDAILKSLRFDKPPTQGSEPR